MKAGIWTISSGTFLAESSQAASAADQPAVAGSHMVFREVADSRTVSREQVQEAATADMRGFGSGFSGGFGGADFSRDGADATADINVTFDEAAFGGDKMINITDPVSGKKTSLKVHIPAGIDTGKSIRLKGRGTPGSNGGKNGDLLLRVNVGSRPGFERKGMDVYSSITVPFSTAVLGGKVPVQTLQGKVMCTIAPGTQSGTKLRIKNKGIVSMNSKSEYGSHYVTVQIEVPKNISPEAKRKLEEFEQLCGKSSRAAA